ncbi:MAG TPA: GxxExxY protein [Promineifilum sp.]|nr:GxxExxY protein [Promineifilum sp.]HRO23929.1 GxxExxY protein [Promineifilum sp.]HRQ14065.1 GxxExxY protein [Promineifilum sp.]
MDVLPRDPQTYSVIGAAMEVHNQLGNGFLEAVYQEALAVELESRHISFNREVTFPIYYKGRQLSTHYRADFICYGTVVVELKALPRLTGIEAAQLINYLKGTGLKTGLLINFGGSSLEYKRFVN